MLRLLAHRRAELAMFRDDAARRRLDVSAGVLSEEVTEIQLSSLSLAELKQLRQRGFEIACDCHDLECAAV